MENNQLLLDQRNKELEVFYEILNETATNKFKVKVVEKKMFQPISTDKKHIYINSKQSLQDKAHFLNGLLIQLTANDIFGKKADKQFNLYDMNYVNDNLYHRYAGDSLANELPTHKENADKVLINMDFAFKKAKEQLSI